MYDFKHLNDGGYDLYRFEKNYYTQPLLQLLFLKKLPI